MGCCIWHRHSKLLRGVKCSEAQGLGFPGLGFRFRVQGLGFRVQDLRVQGLGIRV